MKRCSDTAPLFCQHVKNICAQKQAEWNRELYNKSFYEKYVNEIKQTSGSEGTEREGEEYIPQQPTSFYYLS